MSNILANWEKPDLIWPKMARGLRINKKTIPRPLPDDIYPLPRYVKIYSSRIISGLFLA